MREKKSKAGTVARAGKGHAVELTDKELDPAQGGGKSVQVQQHNQTNLGFLKQAAGRTGYE